MTNLFRNQLCAICLLSCLAWSGCDEQRQIGDAPTCERMRSLVMEYDRLETLEAEADGATIHLGGDRSYLCSWKDEESQERYQALCRENGDLTYDREVCYYFFDLPFCCLAQRFVSLCVRSDADFDADHPAGTELADVIECSFLTLEPYIESAYDLTYRGEYPAWCTPLLEQVLRIRPEYHLVRRRADMLGQAPARLLYHNFMQEVPFFSLKFLRRPSLERVHNLTVELRSDQGELFTARVRMVFE